MTEVRVDCFSISLDAYGAGPNQSLEDPLGERGPELHSWFFPTRKIQATVFGKSGGSAGVDNDMAERSFENVGAWLLGRNMFGAIRGDLPDDSCKGRWGDVPPYGSDVFMLTHYPRRSFALAGMTFHFITNGINAALDRVKASAKGNDVRISGDASTIRQCLQAGLTDTMHIAVSPVLGKGEHLLTGLDLPALGLGSVTQIAGEGATRYHLAR